MEREHSALRTHITVKRNGEEIEFDEWVLPLLYKGLPISIPGAEDAEIVSVLLDCTNEFPIQWVEAR